MTLKSLIPAIIAVILTIIGNVLFFRYQFKKNKKWKILNQQLTELLLPLFYILKEDGFDISECIMDENWNMYEFIAEQPKRLKTKIIPIIKKNLYLADDNLHKVCLEFLEWAYKVDENDRFGKLLTNGFNDEEIFLRFRELIFKKYNEVRNNYLK